eukprot:scaffold3171_cov380-Prasinococcus_capsulatus_cf.AAC.8
MASATCAVALYPTTRGSTYALRSASTLRRASTSRPVLTARASGEKVIVWGGNGFVGSRVCKELQAQVSLFTSALDDRVRHALPVV